MTDKLNCNSQSCFELFVDKSFKRSIFGSLSMVSLIHYGSKQAGTGPSRRHIQGSKIPKGLPSVNLEYSKIEKAKYGPSGAPGPASASPWRAKRGTLPKLSTFLSQLKGGPFGEKIKLKGHPLGKKIFRKKRLAVPKKLKGGTLCSRYGMLRRKTGKTFLVQFARPSGAVWCNNIL